MGIISKAMAFKKLASSFTTMEELQDALRDMGLDLDANPVSPDPKQAISALERFAEAHIGTNEKLFEIKVKTDDGRTVSMFLAMGNQPS